jgi:hypothetical protein
MKPGDLRRFKEGLDGSARCQQLRGHPFMVLETATTETAHWVTFLVDGRIERGWGGDWVESNSETIHEAG